MNHTRKKVWDSDKEYHFECEQCETLWHPEAVADLLNTPIEEVREEVRKRRNLRVVPNRPYEEGPGRPPTQEERDEVRRLLEEGVDLQ